MTAAPDPAAATPGIDFARFRAWLRDEHPQLAPPRSVAILTGGRSNLTMLLSSPEAEYVLRRPPLGAILDSANDLDREYRVQSALYGTPVPVPRLRASQAVADPRSGVETPFYLMDRVIGRELGDRTANVGLTAEEIQSAMTDLVRVLAELHSIRPESVGLADFGRPEGFLARQLGRWSSQLDKASDRRLPALRRLVERLAPAPETSHAAICHGDFKPQNALFRFDGRRGEVAAVIDWEMSTLGDPAADLALFGLYWTMPALHPVLAADFATPVDHAAGYPRFDGLLEEYGSVREVPDMRWHSAFACFKTAVISELIHQRYLKGTTVGDGYDRMGDQVEVLAQIGNDVLDGRQILQEG